jgi:hypothetical protein
MNEMDRKNYEPLREKLREINDLLNEMERAEDPENGLPGKFRREHALNFLKNPNEESLDLAFTWADTPQGEDYWIDIHERLCDDPPEAVPDGAIMQIQKWVIASYQAEFGV